MQGFGMESLRVCRGQNLRIARIRRLYSRGQSNCRSQGAGMAGRGQAKRARWSPLTSFAWGLPMVSSVSGRQVGELHLEFPSRAHGITAPLRSELESLKRPWVTEKNEISLPSESLTTNARPFRLHGRWTVGRCGRTREGMAVAKAKRRLSWKQPKLLKAGSRNPIRKETERQ